MQRDLQGGDVAARWQRAVASNSKPNYEQGIAAVSVNPMELAANQQDKWLAGVQDAAANNRFKNRLQAAGTLQDWKNAALTKGASRIVAGCQAALPKYTAAMNKLMPVVNAAKAQIAAMPKGGKANAMARFERMLDVLYQYKNSR